MREQIRLLSVSAVLGIMLAAIVAGATLASEVTLTATLAGGSAEDPPGDPDGSGTASITIDTDTLEVCWEITTSNIADATASHIHQGAAGVNGGVVVGLDTDGFSGSTSGCTTASDAAVLQAIIDSPSDYYVNVHTADYAPGAIRGQLAAAAAPDTAMAARSPFPTAPTIAGIILLLLGVTAGLRRTASRA